jgi:RNA polymerase primary sigma factor
MGKRETDPSPLTLYLNDIARIPTLSVEEERRVIHKAKRGDRKAFEKLIVSNLKFIVKIAKLYIGRGLSLGDMINEGNIGLMNAFKNFDEKKGLRFLSYAIWWIRQAIQRATSQQLKSVRFPAGKVADSYKIGKVERMLREKTGKGPSIKEIAHAVGMSEKKVLFAMQFAKRDISLDSSISRSEGIIYSDVIGVEDLVMKTLYEEEITTFVKNLPPKASEVMSLYFGLEDGKSHTLREIGKMMHLSRERIRQIKENGIRILRARYYEKKNKNNYHSS